MTKDFARDLIEACRTENRRCIILVSKTSEPNSSFDYFTLDMHESDKMGYDSVAECLKEVLCDVIDEMDRKGDLDPPEYE